MLYEFEHANNATKTSKNICRMKSVDHSNQVVLEISFE